MKQQMRRPYPVLHQRPITVLITNQQEHCLSWNVSYVSRFFSIPSIGNNDNRSFICSSKEEFEPRYRFDIALSNQLADEETIMEDSFDIALPNQLADEELSTYKKELRTLTVSSFASRLKSTIAKKHRVLQMFLLVLALVGACMVIGDSVITPTLSVFQLLRARNLQRASQMSEKSPDLDELCNSCNGHANGFALSFYGSLA